MGKSLKWSEKKKEKEKKKIRKEDRTIRLTADLWSEIIDSKYNKISSSKVERKTNSTLKFNFAVSVRDLKRGLHQLNEGFIVSYQRNMEVSAQEWLEHHKTQIHSHASPLLS